MGVITLPANVETDRQNGIKANSVHVQGNFDALLAAVNKKLENDGSILPVSDLPMNNHKLTGVATPTASGDAATKGYVDSNACMLAGSQTVTGDKDFTGNVSFTGSLTGNITGNVTGDVSGNAGTVTNGVYTTGNQTIGGTKTFSAAAYGQASDATNSILTTVNKSKGLNGYFKLGNGLIIQWGRVANVATIGPSTVNLPTAFSNTNYSVVTTAATSGTAYTGMMQVYDKTTATFKLDNSNTNYNDPAQWLAIGY